MGEGGTREGRRGREGHCKWKEVGMEGGCKWGREGLGRGGGEGKDTVSGVKEGWREAVIGGGGREGGQI